MTRFLLAILPVVVTVLASGCGKGGKERIIMRAPPTPGILSPELAERARAFGHDFAEAVATANLAVVGESFDAEALLDRALDGISLEAKAAADFREGALRGMRARKGGVLHGMLGRSYRFLRVIDIDGESQLLFRCINDEGTVDYHRFRLAVGADGGFRLNDYFGFIGGEYASESLRRMAWPVVDDLGGETTPGTVAPDRAVADSLLAVSGQMIAKEYEQALGRLRALPEAARAMGFLRTLEVQVLAAIPDRQTEYFAAVGKLAVDFAEDPTMALVLASAETARGNFAGVRAQVKRLAAVVGSDAYHDVMVAASHAGDGDFGKALMFAGRATASEPELREAWLFIVSTGLDARDFSAVAAALVRLKDRFGYAFRRDQFENVPAYRDFVGSLEGRTFLGLLES